MVFWILGMKQTFLIPLASFVNLILYSISFYLPWVIVRSPFYYSTWHTSIPVTLGIDECLTSPCIYNKVDSYQGQDVNVDPILQHQFQTVRFFTLLFYTLSAFLALLSFLLHSWKGSENLGIFRYIYPLSVCCLIISSCIYFPFMFVNLNGGYFREGSILLLSSTSFGMGSCTIYFVESPPPFSYDQIP